MAMGVLVERLGEDEQRGPRRVRRRFAEFASNEQRRLVKETFE